MGTTPHTCILDMELKVGRDIKAKELQTENRRKEKGREYCLEHAGIVAIRGIR